MFRRKLFKRVLPVLLSVAMLIGDLPVTGLTVQAATEISGQAETPANLIGSTDGEEALPKAEIVYDADYVVSHVVTGHTGFEYDYTTDTVVVKFDKAAGAAANVETAVKNAVRAKLNNVDNADYTDALKFAWEKQDATGAYVALGAEETISAVGNYRVAVTLDAVAGVSRAADPVVVGLAIEKGSLSIENYTSNIAPGSTVAEVKAANAKNQLDFELSGAYVDKDTYVSAVDVAVKKAYAGVNSEALADEDVLQKNEDYILVFTVTLKDAASYEVEENVFNIILGNAVATSIEVTYTPEGKVIGKGYDGKPIDYDTDVAPYYTAKVVYEKDGVKKTPEGAEITGTWCDANKNAIDGAPTDAGTYYYRLMYRDEKGTYASSRAYVRVVIDMVNVVIKPALASSDVYEGTTAREVTKAATYKVYDVAATQDGADIKIGEYFWGVGYNADTDTTQSYEPVFKLQKGVKNEEKITWSDLDDYNIIEKEENTSYRLVFNGEKALYNEYGWRVEYGVDINNSQGNYTVDTTEATIEHYAVNLNVLDSAKVTIDVSAILGENGAGSVFGNPIVKTYDGAGIYANKGLYKKAVANTADGTKVASDTDDRLTYEWEQLSSNYIANYQDENGNVRIPTEPGADATPAQIAEYEAMLAAWRDGWSVSNYNNVELLASPKNAGVYRIHVTFEDPTHAYRSASADVYYVIKPQDAIIVLNGNPAIYGDGINRVSTLLYSLQNTDAEDTDTYLNVEMYKVTVSTQDGADTSNPERGDALTLSTARFYTNPTKYFYVEKKVTAGDGKVTWVECGNNDVLEADTEYRLNIRYNPTNYNFGYKLGTHNQILKDETNAQIRLYENVTAPITIKKTLGTAVRIVVDETKITKNIKTYDGEGFDLTELKSLVKVVTDDEAQTDVTASVLEKLNFFFEDLSDGSTRPAEYAIHSGNYEVFISLATDDTYRATSTTLDTLYTINRKTLTLTPVFYEPVKAGVQVNSTYAVMQYVVKAWETSGLIEGDADVLRTVYARVFENNSATAYNGYLKSSDTYYVKATDISYRSRVDAYTGNAVSYSRDYEAADAKTTFSPARVAAATEGIRVNINDTVTVDEAGDFNHKIVTVDGVPAGGIAMAKYNYAIVQIYAPAEMTNAYGFSFETAGDYVFRNSIQEAGGLLYNVDTNYIQVAFDATTHKSYSFDILWRYDYVEHFTVDLTKSTLLDDKEEPVAPKSLKFNGAVTKMAVGETQQLDVKITKAQLSDVVLLAYSVDKENILQVNATGYVTALAKGSATVSVTPVDRKGDPVAGGKTVNLKITVTDVAAPKLSKVNAKDDYAQVTYAKPANGFRREIYVLEGKKKAADFEAQIAKVANGAYNSVFVYSSLGQAEATDAKGVVTNRYVYGLAPASEYTVYVRNVSGLRAMGDGSQVAASAAGSVKTFKTTKPQEYDLSASLTKPAVYDSEENVYYVNVSDKTATISVNAYFNDLNSYSDNGDYIIRTLPLAGADKKNYVAPKLVYYVSDDVTDDPDDIDDFSSYVYYGGNYYKKTAAIAKVDKKGKITLNGKGYVTVLVVDQNNGNFTTFEMFINATPDSITAKAVKMQPGQTLWVAGALTYKQGKTKLVDYEYDYADLIVTQESNGYFNIQNWEDGYIVTALKAGGKLDLTVTDKAVAANGGKPATLKITSTAIAPVSNLKASNITDTDASITWNYPTSDPIFNETGDIVGVGFTFRLELKDARGSVLLNELSTMGPDAWDAKTKKYRYSYDLDEDYLQRLSVYTFSVTAVNSADVSKEAKVKIKTTNIPASKYDLDVTDDNDKNSGEVILVDTDGCYDDYYALDDVVLKSGNSYTLEANTDWTPKERMTDTLIWKSTNTKVATVKANAGTYTATLKALKPGETEIQLTSKVTKKVIARRTVRINAVGNGENVWDTNEPYDKTWDVFDFEEVDVEDRDILAVTMDAPITVTLNKGEEQYFVFTAPAYGNYTISATGFGSTNRTLEKNGKIGIRVENDDAQTVTSTVSVTGTMYKTVTLGENKVKGYNTIFFTAPEDNYYTFSYVRDNGTEYKWDQPMSKDATYKTQISTGMTRGKEYTLTVTKREPVDLTTTSKVSVGADEEKWYSFTAPEANVYTFNFTASDETAQIRVDYYTSLMNSWAYTNKNGTGSVRVENISMTKDQTVYFKVTSSTATEEKATEVTAAASRREPAALAAGTAVTASLTGRGDESYYWYSYKAPADGYYAVSVKEAADTTVNESVYLSYYESLTNTHSSDDSSTYRSQLAPATNMRYMAAGEVAYYKVSLRNYGTITGVSADAPFSFTIVAQQLAAVNKTFGLDAAGTDVSLTSKKDIVWYKFTAETAGNYKISSSNNAVMFYNFAADAEAVPGDISPAQDYGNRTYSLAAGQTVYIGLVSTTAASAEAPVATNVKVEVVTP